MNVRDKIFAAARLRLGELLVQRGLIDAAALERALAAQKQSGRRLGKVLVELGLVGVEQIAQAIAEQMMLPYVDLARREIDPDAMRKLPELLARRLRAIVMARRADGAFEVAMADPTDLQAFDALTQRLGSVEVSVSTEPAVLAAIDRHYARRDEIAGLASTVARDLQQANDVLAALGANIGGDDAPVMRLAQSVFEAAVARDVSDIHIEPGERGFAIRYRLDGAMHVQAEADAHVGQALIQRLKLMAHVDIGERRLPQDGRFQMRVADRTVDVRLSTLPTQYGESAVLRLLVQNEARLLLDRLGMPAPILARLRAALAGNGGLVLVTGPTGSGKTTTLYAALRQLNSPQIKIITVEDPIEYRLPGLVQVQVNDKIDLDFARVLRACLRQDPDVILVGEMRDRETAEIGLRAALTGHLVLSTLHTLDAAGAVPRLRDMGVAPYMVALGVRLVLAQRLLRRVCPHCAAPAAASAQELEWLGGDAQTLDLGALAAGRGCAHCGHTGYLGREAIYEMVEMTPELIHLANCDDVPGFMRRAQQVFAEHTLRRHALTLVAQGRTTLAEAMQASAQS